MSVFGRRIDPLHLALVAVILLALLAIFDTASVLRAILAAFLLSIGVPAGAMMLLLIQRLTGGAWGETARAPLSLAASFLPVVAVILLPVLTGLPLVFDWARNPSLIRHADVARWYLNQPAVAGRSIVTLCLWSGFALLVSRRADRLTALLAGLGLSIFGLTLTFVAVDWVLALDVHFKSTAFAMSLATSWMLAGAAFAAVMATKPAPDLLKLMAAFALGLFYLDLMQYLVVYDGNLPDKAEWYLRRSGPLGLLATVLTTLGAYLAPTLAVTRSRWRHSRPVLGAVGTAALAGVAIRTLWWTVPEWEPRLVLVLAIPVSIIGILSFCLAAAQRGWMNIFWDRRKGAVHGT